MGADGGVLAEATSPKGMGGLARDEFEPALAELIADWDLRESTLVMACGMVGSRQGWVEAAYRQVPCTPVSDNVTRAAATDPRLDVRVLPGLSQLSPAPDVMRGEETQIAGFQAMNPDFDGVLCLPGSHTKWVQVSAGEVVSFQTAMTGEIFAALGAHTVLRHSMADDWDAATFLEAVSDGMSRPEALAARAFGLRAEGLLTPDSARSARSRLSGLLVGAELAAARPYWLGMPVALIGAPKLTAHYAEALRAQGVSPILTQGDAATLAGLRAARKKLEPSL
ncbi:2-dehydro-3-deoxygalactonokinase [Palleronia caenipelagi]|uniref:2-dehydro-3-deoxygalactonokinase n=2 Tax=Palleronia caenipelagi TaxID=2489174 RepID=A0A547Q941_9RHOB|nr:2-dehydro-3-deoxygalactonokinase [Palleronia caenipelagi]